MGILVKEKWDSISYEVEQRFYNIDKYDMLQ